MTLVGYVQPRSLGFNLDLRSWLHFCGEQEHFRPIATREGRDPFSGKSLWIPFPHSFELSADNRTVGEFVWNDTEIMVNGDRDLAVPVAVRAATALDAVFNEVHESPTEYPPGPMATFEERIAYLERNRPRS